MQLYDEALQVLKDRFQGGDVVSEDFWMLKRVCKDYLDFLREKSLLDDACRIASNALVLLESVQTFPSPDIWKEVCMILEIFVILGSPSEEIQEVYKRYRKLLRKHPEFKTDKDLKSYDRQLKKRLDVAKDVEISEPQS